AEDRNKGYGFDLSYQRDTSRIVSSESVTFIKDFFSERYSQLRPDFVCCRHVLEHLQDPVGFLQTVRAAAGSQQELVFYFEVPNVLFSLRDMGIWDFIYEHCSYFSTGSLLAAFGRAGFDVLDVYGDFSDQFLGLEARVSPTANQKERNQGFPESESQAILWDVVETFKTRYSEKIDYWYAWMKDAAEQGNRAAVWGAGSKGVTFVNTIKVPGVVAAVVDMNPHKLGRFVGGTGHRVIGPQSLTRDPVDYIIVTNAAYCDEIATSLRDLEVECRLICA
ncbi:MAG: class I SAM-dependent methyltransferase, partial [Nitrososphaera sp.]|nr:class I SAM-dependent methyltransferase [Nitrososphaera sp.]